MKSEKDKFEAIYRRLVYRASRDYEWANKTDQFSLKMQYEATATAYLLSLYVVATNMFESRDSIIDEIDALLE